jgi:hypothetical protein
MMSYNTLLSTMVPRAMSGFPGERHDLAGRHRNVAATSKSFGELAPPGRTIAGLPYHDGLVVALELDLGAPAPWR